MATNTYTALLTQTLSTATSTIDFTSISGAYTDLIIVTNHAYTATDQIQIRVGNGTIDTGTNYSATTLQGSGTTASSSRQTSSSFIYDIFGTSTNDGNNSIIHFMNYANTTTYKTTLSRGNSLGDSTNAVVGLWRSTSAINLSLIHI